MFSAAELAVAVRRRSPKPHEVDNAIRDRTLVKTWAMRGRLHLQPADEAATTMATLSRLQPWRAKAWERYHGVTARDVERVLEILGEVLGAEPLTREELRDRIAPSLPSKAVRDRFGSGWGELLKPAAFAGLLLQGPRRGTEVTFVRSDAWVRDWRTSDPDEAGAGLVRSYLARLRSRTAAALRRLVGAPAGGQGPALVRTAGRRARARRCGWPFPRSPET